VPDYGKLLFDPDALFKSANGGAKIVKFDKDQSIFTQGDPADSVFYIQDGKVKITVLSEQGKEAVIAILGAGDFCGEGCLGGQTVRIASCVAMTGGVAVSLAKMSVIRMVHDNTEFAELFTGHLLARNIRVEADLVDQLFNSSEKRLARLLLILANFGKEGKPERIIPPISQETLAEMIGTTRPRVSYFMNKFRQLGFIDYNGHLAVHSSLLGVILHDEQPKIDK
jgi:CRP/FNR family transcriptional regulator, cyclic AMP receptor protein